MSPLVQSALMLLALAALLLGGLLIAAPPSLRREATGLRRHRFRLFADQRRRAAQAGIRPGVWWTGLMAGGGLGAALGALTGVHVLVAAGAAAGLCALPFAAGFYIEHRLVRSMRAFVELLRELRNRMVQLDVPLDVALLDVARSPAAGASSLLRPVLVQKSISAALQQVAASGQNPVAEAACSLLLLSRSRDHRLLVKLVDGVILPAYEESLEVAEASAITLNGARFTSVLLILFEAGLIFATTRVPSLAAFYNTLPGAAALVVSTLVFFLSVAGIRAAVARPAWPRWDVAAVVAELRDVAA